MMLDLRNGTGQYDAFIVGAFCTATSSPASYVLPVDELARERQVPAVVLRRHAAVAARTSTPGAASATAC